MEGQVRQLGRFHAQICERLRRFIDLLIDEFPFNLVGRVENLPPQKLVQIMSHRLKQPFGDIDVSPLLDDFFVNQLSDLGHGVISGSIKLESLTRRRVIKRDLLERFPHVNGLPVCQQRRLESVARTYVDRPKSFPQMIAGEEVRDTSKLMQELIFEAEKRRWSDNSSFRIDLASY